MSTMKLEYIFGIVCLQIILNSSSIQSTVSPIISLSDAIPGNPLIASGSVPFSQSPPEEPSQEPTPILESTSFPSILYSTAVISSTVAFATAEPTQTPTASSIILIATPSPTITPSITNDHPASSFHSNSSISISREVVVIVIGSMVFGILCGIITTCICILRNKPQRKIRSGMDIKIEHHHLQTESSTMHKIDLISIQPVECHHTPGYMLDKNKNESDELLQPGLEVEKLAQSISNISNYNDEGINDETTIIHDNVMSIEVTRS